MDRLLMDLQYHSSIINIIGLPFLLYQLRILKGSACCIQQGFLYKLHDHNVQPFLIQERVVRRKFFNTRISQPLEEESELLLWLSLNCRRTHCFKEDNGCTCRFFPDSWDHKLDRVVEVREIHMYVLQKPVEGIGRCLCKFLEVLQYVAEVLLEDQSRGL